jgi:hypothetical protein
MIPTRCPAAAGGEAGAAEFWAEPSPADAAPVVSDPLRGDGSHGGRGQPNGAAGWMSRMEREWILTSGRPASGRRAAPAGGTRNGNDSRTAGG